MSRIVNFYKRDVMEPVRCLSSQLTTELMKFRNPQGAEEHWLNREERIGNIPLYIGKIVAVEIGAALLSLTAVVEMVAYGVLFLGAGCYALCTNYESYFYQKMWLLTSSSGFTALWNFGNVVVFNPGCINCVTHESFARHSIDTWDRGAAFKAVLEVAWFVVTIAVAVFGRVNASSLYRMNFIESYTRPEDRLYIADWAIRHRVRVDVGSQPAAGNARAYEFMRYGAATNRAIDEGADFLKEHIFREGQLDAATRDLVLECDAEIYSFVLTRTAYFYVFGAKRGDPVPSFFKPATQHAIGELRLRYTQLQGQFLEPLMRNHMTFDERIDDDQLRTIFNDLRAAAHGELQGSIFLTRCWQKAAEPS